MGARTEDRHCNSFASYDVSVSDELSRGRRRPSSRANAGPNALAHVCLLATPALADDTVTPTPMTRDTGAPPNEHDPRGFTPLILAAYNGQVQAVDFLIAEGGDPCATDPKGNNAQMGVAFKGDSKVADRLLAEHCDVNAVNNVGQTALMMAARFGRTDIVRLLIAHGANAALKDQAGNTAIGQATRQSRDSGASRRRVMPFANGTAADRGLRSPGVFEAYTAETR